MLTPPLTYVPATGAVGQAFTSAFLAGAPAAGDPLFEIRPLAASGQSVYVTAIALMLTASTTSTFSLELTTPGTTSATEVAASLLLDAAGLPFAAGAVIGTAWTVDPVVLGAVPFRLAGPLSSAGQNLLWTFETPIEISDAQSLTVFNAGVAAASACNCWVEFFEKAV